MRLDLKVAISFLFHIKIEIWNFEVHLSLMFLHTPDLVVHIVSKTKVEVRIALNTGVPQALNVLSLKNGVLS